MLVTVTSKNQITMPVAMMERIGWGKGVKLWVELIEGRAELKLSKVNGLLEIKEELARDSLVKKYAKVPVKKLIRMAREMEAKRIDGEA